MAALEGSRKPWHSGAGSEVGHIELHLAVVRNGYLTRGDSGAMRKGFRQCYATTAGFPVGSSFRLSYWGQTNGRGGKQGRGREAGRRLWRVGESTRLLRHCHSKFTDEKCL